MSIDKMCFWERVCVSAGFVLVHDGGKSPGLLQQKLGVTETTFHTRKYRLKMDGVFANTWVTFIYDERELFDVRVTYKEGREKGELSLQEAQNVKGGQATRVGNQGREQNVSRQGREDAVGKASGNDQAVDVCPAYGSADHKG